MKRLCKKNKIPTYKEASKILSQLHTNPEVCEECQIKPCVFGLYVFGKNKTCGGNPLKYIQKMVQ